MINVYMAVTDDEYELPLDIDTSPTELAKRHGVNANTLLSHANYHDKKTRHKGVKADFVRVSIEED